MSIKPLYIATLLVLAVLAACSDATGDKRPSAETATPSTSPPARHPLTVEYNTGPIPPTSAGGQLEWFLTAVTDLPIATAELRLHVAPAVLQVLQPDELNAALAAPGDLHTARYVGHLDSADASIDAVIEHGAGEISVVTISVDTAGLIDDLRFGLVPLRPRAEVGLGPLELPATSGPSAVGTDTIVSTVDAHGRRVPAQLWYPAKPTGSEPGALYAMAATADALAEQLAVPIDDINFIRTGATVAPPVDHDRGRLPIVLLLPGHGVARTHYSAISAELASHGYLVAVLDHPGGANLVEYPDGTTVPPAPPSTTLDVPAEIAIRIADANTIIDILTQLDSDPDSRFHDALDLERVAFSGHSIGGAAAAEAMRHDDRYDIGVNLDGSMSGDVLRTGLDRPFLLMGTHDTDDSWTTFQNASAATVSARIDGVAHMSFTDWPALSGLRAPGDIGVEQIGTLDPTRTITIQRDYLLAFIDLHIKSKKSSLFAEQSSRYPEVTLG